MNPGGTRTETVDCFCLGARYGSTPVTQTDPQHDCIDDSVADSWWRWRATRRRLRDLEKAQQERLDEWLARPKTEEEKERDASIERRLQNPSDEVKAVLKSLGLGKYK